MTDPQDDKDVTPHGAHAADASDSTAEPVRNDPTAPIWAEPTTTLPEPVEDRPAAPPEDSGPSFAPGSSPYAESPPLAAPSPPGSESQSNPYAYSAPPSQAAPAQPQPAQPQPAQPQPEPGQSFPSYGQPQQYEQGQPYPSYGQAFAEQPQPEQGQAYPAYEQQPQVGQPYPAYGQGVYPSGAASYVNPRPTNTSAIVLTVVSVLTMGTCVVGIPSLVLGILALTSNNTDPEGSRRKARIGWIVYAVNWAVVVAIAIIAVIAVFVFADPTTTNGNSF